MSKQVVEKKNKAYLTSAIINTVLCLIPIVIIALSGIKNPNVWEAPYPKFMLYFLIIHTFFAFGVGYAGQMNKIACIIFESVAVLGSVILMILGYVLGNPIIMHLAAAALFVLAEYLSGNSGGNDYFLRYFASVAVIILSLITVLWFVGVGMNVTVHVVIATILNVIFGLLVFFRLKKEIKNGHSFVDEDELSYTEETEEEKEQRKREKRERLLEKRQAQEIAKEERSQNYSKKISPKQQLALEKRNAYVAKYGENATWVVSRSQIEDTHKKAVERANYALDDLNSRISDNNYTIHINNNEYDVKDAIENNKLVWKKINALKRSLKATQRYITKVGNRVFTIDDCGKTFVFQLTNGHCKVKPYNGDEPLRVVINDFTQDFHYGNGFTTFAPFTYDTYRLERRS